MAVAPEVAVDEELPECFPEQGPALESSHVIDEAEDPVAVVVRELVVVSRVVVEIRELEEEAHEAAVVHELGEVGRAADRAEQVVHVVLLTVTETEFSTSRPMMI